jgi:glucosamine 6-phosphate synthetase-like amidotransferase/phosphosugar isomerase protein
MAKKKTETEVGAFETPLWEKQVEAPVEEAPVDDEQAQKDRYEAFMAKYKVDIERQIESSASSIQAHGDLQLKALAEQYDRIPFNYFPQTANAVKAELLKRGFEKEATVFDELLETIPWYKKPWIHY